MTFVLMEVDMDTDEDAERDVGAGVYSAIVF